MSKCRVAIIGMGKMGKIRYQSLEQHGGFDIVAICDVNSAIAEAYPKATCYSKWQDILALELDAVFVCTFNDVICEIVCASLDRGFHVFSEKPPGRNVADVSRMMEANDRNPQCKVKFGFNHRLHYGVMEAKALIDSKRYGELMWARGVYGKAGGQQFGSDWRANPSKAGGGILLDQGIHMLDLLLYFVGDFVEVKSMVENAYWSDVRLEDNAFALMRTETGKVAMMHSSATQWKHKFSLELFMKEGYIIVNGILSSTRSYGEESVTFAKKQFEDETRAVGKPREETIYFDRDDSWRLEIEEFYDVVTGKKTEYHGTLADSFRCMSLVYQIYDADPKGFWGEQSQHDNAQRHTGS